MEEIKETNVKMENAPEAGRPEKMSYEQLENIAHQLSDQAKHLYAKLQEANMVNMFSRCDSLTTVKVTNCNVATQQMILIELRRELPKHTWTLSNGIITRS